MVLPYDQTPDLKTTPDQQTEDSSVSFSPPQNWGAPNPSAATNLVGDDPRVDPQNPTLSVIASLVLEPKRSPTIETDSPPSALKVILISLALILLGILLGILAAKFFSPAPTSPTLEEKITPTTEDILPSSTPTLIATPTATPEALLKLNWKNYSSQKYNLYYPSTWVLKYTTNRVTLSKGKNTLRINLPPEGSASNCDSSIIHTFSKNTNLWDIQEASPSSAYYVCEDKIAGTQIGNISFEGKQIDQNTLDEFKLILEKIDIIQSKEESSTLSYKCPESGWVGCMPVLSDEGKKACSSEAMAWYKSNCPNFQGGAM